MDKTEVRNFLLSQNEQWQEAFNTRPLFRQYLESMVVLLAPTLDAVALRELRRDERTEDDIDTMQSKVSGD